MLDGYDAYTRKHVAAASGTGKVTTATELPVLLESAVYDHIDGFNNLLRSHFDDLLANGREISFECHVTESGDVDFETEFDGEELTFIIDDWVADNTVNGRFTNTYATETKIIYEQVRIPMKTDRGRNLDARGWARGLTSMLKDKYGIETKFTPMGPGRVIIHVGSK
jgi:hypothetical protein